MKHESGLPFAIDRSVGKDEQQSVVFYGRRPFIQSGELNEMQTIIRGRHDRLGRLVAKEGDRVERADAFVNKDNQSVTLTEGKIYIAGDIFPVSDAVLTNISMIGRIEIGVKLQKKWVTHEDDPELLGQIPGTLAEGEPGAARESAKLVWALKEDDQQGTFFPVYILQDGILIDQKSPSLLEPAMQAIASYDRAHGHYIVGGCRVTALGKNGQHQVFSIQEGEANINGFKRKRLAALRHEEIEDFSEGIVPSETHIFAPQDQETNSLSNAQKNSNFLAPQKRSLDIATAASGSISSHTPSDTTLSFPSQKQEESFTFRPYYFPIAHVHSILLTKEKTVHVTRGALVSGRDGVPDKSITAFIKIVQGTKEFKEGTDFKKTGDTIDWAPMGEEPLPGSSYTVTYRYRARVQADKVTAQEITVSGGAIGGDIIVSYTYKLPRIDRIGLNAKGNVVYIKGVSADDPMAPSVPDDVLSLATIRNNWLETPQVINDGTRVAPYDEMWRYFQHVLSLDRLMQLERIKSNVDSKEPVAKKGMFVDPFLDDSLRDEGFPQTGAIDNGILQLAIDPTFYSTTLTEPVTLDWTNEVIIAQELTTACEKINPYQNFAPLPGIVSLNPATDFWHEQRTDWLSSITHQLHMGRRRGRGLRKEEVKDDLINETREQIDFLRQIKLNFKIEGFGKREILESLTFDGVDVLPNSRLVANAKGSIEGDFKIPANIPSGTKNVVARGKGGTIATGLFTGQGIIDVKVMRRTTTVKIWTGYDPQAQVFTPDETRQITGVDFHLCKIGNQNHDLVIDLVSTENGYPTADIQAQTSYSMKGAKEGWAGARYDVPLTVLDDRLTAFVIKTDDADHSVSLAKLGDFDAEHQRYVSSHPYVTGPRFSSVNAKSWSAHQDEALAFRVLAARYTQTEKTVDLGEFDLVDCSDLQVRAAVELPSSDCSVIFEVERNNGTVYQLLPFQLLSLTEYISEKVKLRAILKGTEKLSPVLFAPIQLIAGKIHKQATYVTRAFTFGEKARLTSYIKTFLPGGATFLLEMQLDDGTFVPLKLDETEQLAEPLWTERKFISDDKTAKQARLKITLTGGPAARSMVRDFGAGIV
ncbi:DUF4815 domain-containing protein [Bartonella henselae]|uniref:DUF4815 domain-containing protein n=1 Tax=Bartonella henselae TaxID=38323 RepID=UPI0003DFA132|nr:DUF4815 domain-containing protein [Bartonella henselae]ETS07678.1 hypothetical protein Q653_01332 [Bartonella henselae JK 42]ETS16481.1 hypothetical protein Q652_00166 [Bartonella henselae JK 41]KEC57658.1 hypothetical protein O97_00693 [Bartonella henselae str. Zeus]KEC63020.1 hypothetical protein O95_00629 [Bartonella henselae JK 53]MDM9983853.1 DUF4815 domain-containing protein [Bartonella henselae]